MTFVETYFFTSYRIKLFHFVLSRTFSYKEFNFNSLLCNAVMIVYMSQSLLCLFLQAIVVSARCPARFTLIAFCWPFRIGGRAERNRQDSFIIGQLEIQLVSQLYHASGRCKFGLFRFWRTPDAR